MLLWKKIAFDKFKEEEKMRKSSVCLLVLLWVMMPLQQAFSDLDYSKYLAPKAWQAIQSGQGVLYSIDPTFSKPDTGLSQALVVEAKNGWLLSVAHGISKYPAVAYGKDSQYWFVFRGTNFRAELKNISHHPVDLALFKIEAGDLSKLKSISLAKNAEPFEEYYSFSQRVSPGSFGGFEVDHNIPWKALLIDRQRKTLMIPHGPFISMPLDVERLVFDKAVAPGFSGAGVFDGDGKVIGMIQALSGGLSLAVSYDTVFNFLKDYLPEGDASTTSSSSTTKTTN